jgi:hypothetical protein
MMMFSGLDSHSIGTTHYNPYLFLLFKTRSTVSLGLKLMLSLLFAKKVTVTASVLNQDMFFNKGVCRTFHQKRMQIKIFCKEKSSLIV